MKDAERLDEAIDLLVAHDFGERRVMDVYPEHAELRRLLAVAREVRSLSRQRLSPMARARQTRLLMEQARAHRPMATTQATGRRRTGLRKQMRLAAALALIALLALPAAAALASDSLPDESLFGMKLAVERLRLAIERGAAEDAGLHLDFADNRLREISQAVSEGREHGLDRALANLEGHLAAAGAAGVEGDSFAERFILTNARHVEVLEDLIDKAACDAEDPEAGDPQCKGLLNALDNSTKHLEDPPSNSRRQGNRNTPAGPPEGWAPGKPDEPGRPDNPGPPTSRGQRSKPHED